MSDSETKVAWILEAVDRASATFDKVGGAAGKTAAIAAKVGPAVAAGGAAMAAVGALAARSWNDARRVIVDGTGATGDALDGLMGSFDDLAGSIKGVTTAEISTALADLNTHLGLTGPALENVSEQAIKAGVDTNLFGSVLKQLDADAGGAVDLLDQLTVVSQATGVSVDQLTATVGKNSARFQAAGGSVEDLVDHVVNAAYEFGPSGIRGAMSETMEEVDKGLIPVVKGLTEHMADAAAQGVEWSGAVDRTHDATVTLTDRLGALKDGLLVAIGPWGDTLTAVGGVTSAFGGLAMGMPAIVSAMGGVGTAAKAMWLAMSGPTGLAIAAIVAVGAAAWFFRDEITAAFGAVLRFILPWVDNFLGVVEGVVSWIPGVGDELSAMVGTARAKLGEFSAATETWGQESEAAADATADAFAGASAGIDTASASMGAAVAPTDALAGAQGKLVVQTVAATVAVEAFDLSTVSAGDSLRLLPLPDTKLKFEDLVPAIEAPTLAFGFFADELDILHGKVGQASRELPPLIGQMLTPPPSLLEVEPFLREVYGPSLGEGLLGGLQSTFSPANVGATLSRAFESGGGLVGGLKSIGVQAASGVVDKISGFLGAAGPWGQAAAAALQVAAAFAGKIWGGIKQLFGGPSQAVVEARDSLQAYGDTVDADTVNQERLQDWISGGFAPDHAKIVTQFQDLALATGETAQAGVDLWLRYQRAVEDGNQAGVDAVMAQVEAWGGSVEVLEAAREAAEAYAAGVADVTRELLGLPTAQVVADHEMLRAAWDGMDTDQRAQGWDAYTAALVAAADAGIVLTAAEQAIVDAMAERELQTTLMIERQQAEVDAFEAGAVAKMDMLRDTQTAELDALRAGQQQQLDDLRASQDAQLAEIESARAAALGVVEAAIARELEDERIAAQLIIDLQKAGHDQEAIDAAHARAVAASGRLTERDQLAAMMEAAEERVRARYQDELDAIDEHFDDLEDARTTQFNTDLQTMEARHGVELTELESHHTAQTKELEAQIASDRALMEAAHAQELAAHEAHWDGIEEALRTHGAAAVVAATATVDDINAATSRLEDRVVTITTVHESVYISSGGEGEEFAGERALGGPVSRGRAYLVGERGPELFVPHASGRIEPSIGMAAARRPSSAAAYDIGGGSGGGGTGSGGRRGGGDRQPVVLEIDRQVLGEVLVDVFGDHLRTQVGIR